MSKRTSRWQAFFEELIAEMPRSECVRTRRLLGAHLTTINNELQVAALGGVRVVPDGKRPYVDFLMRKRDSMEKVHKRLVAREILAAQEDAVILDEINARNAPVDVYADIVDEWIASAPPQEEAAP